MRRLALLPLLAFVFACGDSTLLQPEEDQTIAASAHDRGRDARMEYTFQFSFDQALYPEDAIINGFFVTGDLEGYAYLTGQAAITDPSNGFAEGDGLMMVVLTEPGIGAFNCSWRATWEDFFAGLNLGEWYACTGTGDFEGKKLWSENNNARDPAVSDAVAVIWGALGPSNDG
jgi:hypothetical protein